MSCDRSSAPLIAAVTVCMLPAAGARLLAQTADDNAAVLASGVWAYLDADGEVVVSGSFLGVPPDDTLTESARALRDAFDFRTDDPVLGCGEPGMPRALTAGSPMEFRWEGDDLLIHYESMDVERHVAMNGVPANSRPTPNGSSFGRWEGATLVIETTGLDERVMDLLGTPKTQAMRIVERYSIETAGDSTHLSTDLTLDDPNVFKEPYEWRFEFVLKPDWELLEYACEERPASLTPGVVAD